MTGLTGCVAAGAGGAAYRSMGQAPARGNPAGVQVRSSIMARFVGKETDVGAQFLSRILTFILLLVILLVLLKLWHPAFAFAILNPLGLW